MKRKSKFLALLLAATTAVTTLAPTGLTSLSVQAAGDSADHVDQYGVYYRSSADTSDTVDGTKAHIYAIGYKENGSGDTNRGTGRNAMVSGYDAINNLRDDAGRSVLTNADVPGEVFYVQLDGLAANTNNWTAVVVKNSDGDVVYAEARNDKKGNGTFYFSFDKNITHGAYAYVAIPKDEGGDVLPYDDDYTVSLYQSSEAIDEFASSDNVDATKTKVAALSDKLVDSQIFTITKVTLEKVAKTTGVIPKGPTFDSAGSGEALSYAYVGESYVLPTITTDPSTKYWTRKDNGNSLVEDASKPIEITGNMTFTLNAKKTAADLKFTEVNKTVTYTGADNPFLASYLKEGEYDNAQMGDIVFYYNATEKGTANGANNTIPKTTNSGKPYYVYAGIVGGSKYEAVAKADAKYVGTLTIEKKTPVAEDFVVTVDEVNGVVKDSDAKTITINKGLATDPISSVTLADGTTATVKYVVDGTPTTTVPKDSTGKYDILYTISTSDNYNTVTNLDSGYDLVVTDESIELAIDGNTKSLETVLTNTTRTKVYDGTKEFKFDNLTVKNKTTADEYTVSVICEVPETFKHDGGGTVQAQVLTIKSITAKKGNDPVLVGNLTLKNAKEDAEIAALTGTINPKPINVGDVFDVSSSTLTFKSTYSATAMTIKDAVYNGSTPKINDDTTTFTVKPKTNTSIIEGDVVTAKVSVDGSSALFTGAKAAGTTEYGNVILTLDGTDKYKYTFVNYDSDLRQRKVEVSGTVEKYVANFELPEVIKKVDDMSSLPNNDSLFGFAASGKAGTEDFVKALVKAGVNGTNYADGSLDVKLDIKQDATIKNIKDGGTASDTKIVISDAAGTGYISVAKGDAPYGEDVIDMTMTFADKEGKNFLITTKARLTVTDKDEVTIKLVKDANTDIARNNTLSYTYADENIAKLTAPVIKVLNGNDADITTEVSSGITAIYKDSTGTVIDTETKPLNTWDAGTYTANIVVNTTSRYGVGSFTIVIAKADPSVTDFTTGFDVEFERLDADNMVIAAVDATPAELDGNYTLYYSKNHNDESKISEDSTWAKVVADGDADTYYVYAKIDETTNYNAGLIELGSINVVDKKSEYTVSFDADNGSAVVTQKVENGAKATKPADPTKEGYKFLGWFADGSETAFDFENTAITADMTLTAKWEEDKTPVEPGDSEADKAVAAEAAQKYIEAAAALPQTKDAVTDTAAADSAIAAAKALAPTDAQKALLDDETKAKVEAAAAQIATAEKAVADKKAETTPGGGSGESGSGSDSATTGGSADVTPSSGGSGGSGGGGSSNSTTKKNADGSTTTTTTTAKGTIETTTKTNADGSKTTSKVVKNKDGSGSVTETSVSAAGTTKVVEVVTDTTGAATEVTTTVSNSKGASMKVTYAAKGTAITVSKVETTGKTAVSIPATVKVGGKTYKVTKIAASALKGNKEITKVTLGKNVKSIGKNAFNGDSKLKTIVMKKAPTTVGKNAFKGIAKKATIKIKATKKAFKTAKKLIKKSGIASTVKIKRTK